jgi:hypothetical protein
MPIEEETRQRTRYRPVRLETYLKNTKLSKFNSQLTITELAAAHLFSYSTTEVKII